MAHFYSVSSIPAVLQFNYMLLLPEDKQAKPGDLPKAVSFGHWGALDRNALTPFCGQRVEHHHSVVETPTK
jgi:hypothetical protein